MFRLDGGGYGNCLQPEPKAIAALCAETNRFNRVTEQKISSPRISPKATDWSTPVS